MERSLQSSIISLRTYKTIITHLWHLVVIQSKLSSAKDVLFICCIQFILAARPIFFFQFGGVETKMSDALYLARQQSNPITIISAGVGANCHRHC